MQTASDFTVNEIAAKKQFPDLHGPQHHQTINSFEAHRDVICLARGIEGGHRDGMKPNGLADVRSEHEVASATFATVADAAAVCTSGPSNCGGASISHCRSSRTRTAQ